MSAISKNYDMAKSENASVSQSKIDKYFQRKQMEPFDFRKFNLNIQSQQIPSKGLGFATPILEHPKYDLFGMKSGSGSKHGHILH